MLHAGAAPGRLTHERTASPRNFRGEAVGAPSAWAHDHRTEDHPRWAPGATLAVAVVLRSIKVHEVDSNSLAFRHAGRLAVRNALVEAYGPPPRPRRDRA